MDNVLGYFSAVQLIPKGPGLNNLLPNGSTSGDCADQTSGYGHLIEPLREHDGIPVGEK